MILSTVVRNINKQKFPNPRLHPSPPHTSNQLANPSKQINATPHNTPATAPANFCNAAEECAISSAVQMISIAENSRTLFAMENSVVVLGPVESILPMLRRRIIIGGVRSMGMIRVGEKDIL